MYSHLPEAAALAAEPASGGFEIATIVLIVMIVSVIYTFIAMFRGVQGHTPRKRAEWVELLVPILSVIGMGVACYLAYVEITLTEAVCGPVGDCNAVNSSPYARLFGILPVGLLGVGGYITILAVWAWGRFRSDRLADSMPALQFGLTLFGTLFSIYLTYLEVWVILAICMWCISSAVIMTVLLVLSINPALRGMAELEDEPLESTRKEEAKTGA
ncbi:MAG: vitamin K epoxide reductase family protein [Anaerolineae bacterium]|nr:vitamin K epoxide reductase family protein [Anaerolineae bacterium]